jgi:hypothetical protein
VVNERLIDKRDEEGGGLAGAGIGEAHYVAALDDIWNDLVLDRRWVFVVPMSDTLLQPLVDMEVVKAMLGVKTSASSVIVTGLLTKRETSIGRGLLAGRCPPRLKPPLRGRARTGSLLSAGAHGEAAGRLCRASSYMHTIRQLFGLNKEGEAFARSLERILYFGFVELFDALRGICSCQY